ncbi:hypothetical protein KGF57_003459 [Candida theae]|uniref:Uncharacterized protein n=1 Tax=Candida theae TaxID=1198502 RepID=A0AAD5BCX4_9ASCO|nr:uncharacterized protein KGF57_003459 [Candida theae]KAI5955974.1 hypothetical protein KGF57_003459 [Candida theae]
MSLCESYNSSVTFSATERSKDTWSTLSLPALASNRQQLVILLAKVMHTIDGCPYYDTHALLLAHRQLCDDLSTLRDLAATQPEDMESFTAFMANNRLDHIMNKVIFDSFLNGGAIYTTYRVFLPTHQLIAILFSICETCQVTFKRELFLDSIDQMINLRAKYLAANRLEPRSIIGNIIEDVLSKLAPDPEILQLLRESLRGCNSSSEAKFLMGDIAAFTTNLNMDAVIAPEDFDQLKKSFEEILVLMLTRNYNELYRDTYKVIRDCYNTYFHHINLNTGVYEPNSTQQNSDVYQYEVSSGIGPNLSVRYEEQPSQHPNTWVPSFLEDDHYNENTNTVNRVEIEKPRRNPFKMIFRRRVLTEKRWHLFHRKQHEV